MNLVVTLPSALTKRTSSRRGYTQLRVLRGRAVSASSDTNAPVVTGASMGSCLSTMGQESNKHRAHNGRTVGTADQCVGCVSSTDRYGKTKGRAHAVGQPAAL